MLFTQTVLLTPTFLRQVNAVGLDEDELQEIVTVIGRAYRKTTRS
jgi:ADP-dependent phosphofructokinase/glucokinase